MKRFLITKLKTLFLKYGGKNHSSQVFAFSVQVIFIIMQSLSMHNNFFEIYCVLTFGTIKWYTVETRYCSREIKHDPIITTPIIVQYEQQKYYGKRAALKGNIKNGRRRRRRRQNNSSLAPAEMAAFDHFHSNYIGEYSLRWIVGLRVSL